MTSVIYYKLKSAIQQHHINFDGSVIQIGDVKRLVAQKQGLGPDGALELTLFDSNTGDEYVDDNKVIPRNTLVLVKRTPGIKLKPLVAGEQMKTAQRVGPRAPAGAPDQQPLSQPSQASQPQLQQELSMANEFGDDLYASVAADNDNAAGIVGEDESKALHSLLQGTAATWQREVRQGALRGRGRGRGRGAGPPPEYRCPRCEVVGVHWLQDCPTHGDPTYDRKRVRPPVGIPMTRLARSNEGGLVLPDGQMGTLVANEDAFAREVLGLGLIGSQGSADTQAQAEQVQARSPINPQPVRKEETPALEYPKPDAAIHHGVTVPPQGAPPPPAVPTFQPLLKASTMSVPKLAGGALLRNDGLFHKDTPDASFFDFYMKAAFLPRGPTEFLRIAYGGRDPLTRSEFERLQEEYLIKLNLPTKSHKSRDRFERFGGGEDTFSKFWPRGRSDGHPPAKSPIDSESERRNRSRSGERSRRDEYERSRSRDRKKRREDTGRHIKSSEELEVGNLSKKAVESNKNKEEQLGTRTKEEEEEGVSTKRKINHDNSENDGETRHNDTHHSDVRHDSHDVQHDIQPPVASEPDLDYGSSDPDVAEVAQETTKSCAEEMSVKREGSDLKDRDNTKEREKEKRKLNDRKSDRARGGGSERRRYEDTGGRRDRNDGRDRDRYGDRNRDGDRERQRYAERDKKGEESSEHRKRRLDSNETSRSRAWRDDKDMSPSSRHKQRRVGREDDRRCEEKDHRTDNRGREGERHEGKDKRRGAGGRDTSVREESDRRDRNAERTDRGSIRYRSPTGRDGKSRDHRRASSPATMRRHVSSDTEGRKDGGNRDSHAARRHRDRN